MNFKELLNEKSLEYDKKKFVFIGKQPKDTTKDRTYYVTSTINRKDEVRIFFVNDKRVDDSVSFKDIKVTGDKPKLSKDYTKGPVDGKGLYWE